MEEKLNKIGILAKEIADGHYTIMKFSGNYRAGYGTNGERHEICRMRAYKTLNDCIDGLLKEGEDEMFARFAEGTISLCELNKKDGGMPLD